MAPPRWTNAAQLEFLQQNVEAYLSAQAKSTLFGFIPTILLAWFQKFPERESLFGANKDLDELCPLSQEQTALLAAAIEKRKAVSSYEISTGVGKLTRTNIDPVADRNLVSQLCCVRTKKDVTYNTAWWCS